MAQPPTIHRVHLELTDVDRGVYETLDLRLARHPSETVRFMVLRVLAYALSYEDGIAFSKEGLSNPDEPPLTVTDPTGLLVRWIEVGSPSGDRLHKAAKACRRVDVFTAADLNVLRREVRKVQVHRLDDIALWHFEPSFVAAIEGYIGRETRLALTRTDGALYVTIGGETLEHRLEQQTL
jgi:uncharacterized protein YaeQ